MYTSIKQIEYLKEQNNNLTDKSNKFELTTTSLQLELNYNNEDLIKFQSLINDLEKFNKDKEIMITEQLNEREHLKTEINEARFQLQHCLAEVFYYYYYYYLFYK